MFGTKKIEHDFKKVGEMMDKKINEKLQEVSNNLTEHINKHIARLELQISKEVKDVFEKEMSEKQLE